MRLIIASIIIASSFLFIGARPALAEQCACTKTVDNVAEAVICVANLGACEERCNASNQTCTCQSDPVLCPEGQTTAAPDQPVGIPLPLGNVSVQGLIGRIIKTLLGLVGTLALVMFIYGGFLYMTSAGNEEKVTKGKNTIVWAILGLIAVFGAYSIVDFVIKAINK